MNNRPDFERELIDLQLRDLCRYPDRPLRYSVYVISVSDGSRPAQHDYYVGSTCQSLPDRVAEHRARAPRAARIFKNGTHTAGELCPELMPHGAIFASREAAVEAEGLLADHLQASGLPVHSDRLGKGGGRA